MAVKILMRNKKNCIHVSVSLASHQEVVTRPQLAWRLAWGGEGEAAPEAADQHHDCEGLLATCRAAHPPWHFRILQVRREAPRKHGLPQHYFYTEYGFIKTKIRQISDWRNIWLCLIRPYRMSAIICLDFYHYFIYILVFIFFKMSF